MLLSRAAWAYFAATLLALAILYLVGDNWWPGTLLLFGPRWSLALPLALLLPLALWRCRRALLPLALGGLIVAIPFMGLRWSFFAPRADEGGVVMRVLTCNVRTGNFNSGALSRVIRDRDVDLVALQECPPSVQLDLPAGWQKTQAGVITVMSRYPIQALEPVLAKHPPHVWTRHSLLPCIVATPRGTVAFHSVYLPSPRYGLQNSLDRSTGIDPRKAGLLVSETDNRRNVAHMVREAAQTKGMPFILAGDFNMPVESAIYQETWSDLSNAFSKRGRGYGWSFRDSVRSIPVDVRIDHVLSGNGASPLSCEVGPDVGSDHRPLIAEILIAQAR
ncbi:MAG: endonuclease/exonuclease/phosphatase family protein [Acidobacteriota bacterium]